MSNKLIFGSLVVAAFLVLGALADRVGGVTIRRLHAQATQPDIQLSQPVLPGVVTRVYWTVPPGLSDGLVTMQRRTKGGEVVLGAARLFEGQLALRFPCEELTEQASLLLVDATWQRILAWTAVDFLPPGPDCFR